MKPIHWRTSKSSSNAKEKKDLEATLCHPYNKRSVNKQLYSYFTWNSISYNVRSSAIPGSLASFSSSLWIHLHQYLNMKSYVTQKTIVCLQISRQLIKVKETNEGLFNSRRLRRRCSCFRPFSSSETKVFICLMSIPRRF